MKNLLRNRKFLYTSMIAIVTAIIIILGVLVGFVQKNNVQNDMEIKLGEEREKYVYKKDKELEQKVNPDYSVSNNVLEREEIKEDYSDEYKQYSELPEDEKKNVEVIPRKYDVEYSELDEIIEKENKIIEQKSNDGNVNNSNSSKSVSSNTKSVTQNSRNSSNKIVDETDKNDSINDNANGNSEGNKDEVSNIINKNDAVINETNGESEDNGTANDKMDDAKDKDSTNTSNVKEEDKTDYTDDSTKNDDKGDNTDVSINNNDNTNNQNNNSTNNNHNVNQNTNKNEDEENNKVNDNTEKKDNTDSELTNKDNNNQENNKKSDDANKTEIVKNEEKNTKNADDDEVKNEEKGEDLPSRYNLADVMNIQVENQLGFGLCWDFASLKVLETNLKQTKDLDYNFSEIYVDYMSSNLLSSNARKVHEGGDFSTFVNCTNVAKGQVLGEKLAYRDYSKDEYLSFINMDKVNLVIADTVSFPTYKPEMNWTNEQFEKYQDAIKRHIMNFGGLYMASKVPSGSSPYWFYENSSDFASASSWSHALVIVGWDDNYSKENFISASGKKPNKDGAYIVLNSYGDTSGDNGYVYISYEDCLVHTNICGIISTDKKDLLKLSEINNNVLQEYIEREFNSYIIYQDGSAYISKEKLEDMTTLDLSNIGLTSLEGIELFKNVRVLDISNNRISNISNLENLKKLTYLNVSNNSGILGIERLTELVKLEARNCNIKDASVFDNLRLLSYLDISDNQEIANLEVFQSNRNILTLKLQNCNIRNVNDIVSLYVDELDISNNKQLNLEKMGGKSFYVKRLIMRNCNIKDASKLDINWVNELDISENPGIINIDSLKNISTLIMSDNNLSEVPNVQDFEYLQYLDLSYNNIQDVSKLNNTNIKQLDLSGNKHVYGDLSSSKISYLKLNNCDLNDQFDFFGITNLDSLEFLDNNLRMESLLQKVNCKNIEIDEWDYDALSKLSSGLIIENTKIYKNVSIPSGKYRIFLRQLFGDSITTGVDIICPNGIWNSDYLYLDIDAKSDFEIEIRGVNDSTKHLVNCNLIINCKIDNEVEPTGMAVTRFPNKMIYDGGERLDYSGLEISEIYGGFAYKTIDSYDIVLDSQKTEGAEYELDYGTNKVVVKKGGLNTLFYITYKGEENAITIQFTNKKVYEKYCFWSEARYGLISKDNDNMTMKISNKLVEELTKGDIQMNSDELGELKNLSMIDFKYMQIYYKNVKIDSDTLKEMKELFPNLEDITVYKPKNVEDDEVIDKQDYFKVKMYAY